MFTTSITWAMGPVAFLAALPLARRFGWFWAEIPGHVKERAIGTSEWIWESGRGEMPEEVSPIQGRFPIRIFIFAPFIALVLAMVGATAIVALQTADDDAQMLATRLHQAMSANIRLQLDDYGAVRRRRQASSAKRRSTPCCEARPSAPMVELSSLTDRQDVARPLPAGDPVVGMPLRLSPSTPDSLEVCLDRAIEFQFDHVTESRSRGKRG